MTTADQHPRRLEYLPLDQIEKAARNPKRHDRGGIKKSMRRFGYTQPIMLDERTGRLVSGHGRHEQLRELHELGKEPPEGVVVAADGSWLAPVIRGWASENDREAEAYVIADNMLTEAGGWDRPELAAVLTELRDDGALSGTGFSAPKLDALLAELEKASLSETTSPPNPRNKRGGRDLDLILTVNVYAGGSSQEFVGNTACGPCCLAVNAGWRYGCNSSMVSCALAERWKLHRPVFIDNAFTAYDHARHVAHVAHFRPKYATVRDAMDEEQCARAGIDYYPLDQIIDMADELSEHAERIIVIPKYLGAIERIPERFMLGYSIPSAHGGTPLPTERFRGRDVHLLGGSATTQYRYQQKLPNEVVSIDNNALLRTCRVGIVTGPSGESHRLSDYNIGAVANPFHVALVLSLGHIGAWFGKSYQQPEDGAEEGVQLDAAETITEAREGVMA